MLSRDEFFEFYMTKGHLPNDISPRKNELNEKQLNSRYEKYLQSERKRQEAQERYAAPDEKWEELKSHLDLRSCQLHEALLINDLPNQISTLEKNAGHLFRIIDPAHIFGKGAHPHMKYDLDNVVPLNRYSHSMLDQSRDPICGNQVSSEEIVGWWMFIVGKLKYTELLSRSKN